MITKYLPKFKVFEVNNLTGLRNGHMLSQIPADGSITTKTVGNAAFIENGLIVGLGKDGTVVNYSATDCAQIFVHYTEELNTFLSDLEYFAVPVEDSVAYPRCIALYVGDSFTTNNYTGTLAGAKAAKVGTDGVLVLQTEADADSLFLVAEGTLPNGEEAAEFTYCGKVVAA